MCFAEVLHERHLSLSRKKSRIGCIKNGFHFLGIYYSPTQPENYTTATHANDDVITPNNADYYLANGGGNRLSNHQLHEKTQVVPHPRTLRKAREQVKHMVIDEVSPRRIRNYLHRRAAWWVKTSDAWQY